MFSSSNKPKAEKFPLRFDAATAANKKVSNFGKVSSSSEHSNEGQKVKTKVCRETTREDAITRRFRPSRVHMETGENKDEGL